MSQTQVQLGFVGDNVVTETQIAAGAVTTAKLDSTVSGALVPIGGIIMWSGVTIPSSWALCNGQTVNGQVTPNLQNKFIVGAGSAYAVAATGGSADATLVSHSHTGTTGGQSADHTHPYNHFDCCAGSNFDGLHGFRTGGGNTYNAPDMPGVNTGGTSNNHTHDFTTSDAKNGVGTIISASATNANLPPYYALAFIMRVS